MTEGEPLQLERREPESHFCPILQAASPKSDELSAYIASEKRDMKAMAETWAASTHLMCEFLLTGYDGFQNNRKSTTLPDT